MNKHERKPVYIIAEAGVNHNGDPQLALDLIDVAAEAGADAVKFQTFKASKLASTSAPKAKYQTQTTCPGESQLEMLRKLELPEHVFADLRLHAERRGIEFLSSPFDTDSLQMLLALGMKKVKIPSGELTNGPLLWEIAHSKLPIILSTGMATPDEIEQALAIIFHGRQHSKQPGSVAEVQRFWNQADGHDKALSDVSLLHCTSEYPAPFDQVNLLAMIRLGERFGLPVGYSDHTEGIVVPIAAAALGATIIEKHFTLDKSMEGPDHRASLSPSELKQMVLSIRQTEACLGDGIKRVQPGEASTRQAARQQLVASRAVLRGQMFVREDITTARYGTGLPPTMLWQLVGAISSRDYLPGDLIAEPLQ